VFFFLGLKISFLVANYSTKVVPPLLHVILSITNVTRPLPGGANNVIISERDAKHQNDLSFLLGSR